ncbi:NAD(P)-binding protein [Pseudobdellovibrio sp. HCB154]|uniref:NAD(P)-binding protein n=1 Tax=Pseudobdellovibrio sp. HCB154 TaxID=3386277 RepID=UPI0039175CB3
MHIYDYIIIGSGLTGQTIATQLSQETQNVLLIEAEAFTGGSNRQALLNGNVIDAGMRFLPANDLSIKAVEQLENLLGLKLIKSEKENHPQTYDASGFKPFVGFGDKSPEFYDQFSYFLSPKELELTLPVHQIMELLKNKYQGETLMRSHVTKFGFAEQEEGSKADPQLTHVVVNGSKTYYANNFIYAGPVRDLALIVPDDVLNIRAKAKLKKDSYWMAICLDLFHQDLTTEQEGLFVLDGTTDDGIGPCAGRFLPGVAADVSPTQKAQQISQWISFIDLTTAEETENVGEVLKKMKRQIKRAFPEMSDAIKAERIFMSPPLSGGELKMNSNGTLHKVNNLWIASASMNQYPNLLGSLLQSQMTLAALGFGGFQMAKADFAEEQTSNNAETQTEAEL